MALILNTQTGDLTGKQTGSNDSWIGTGTYYGDAYGMYGSSTGGNDKLTGGGAVGQLITSPAMPTRCTSSPKAETTR